MGAQGIFIDDPVKNRAEANSETYRENTYDWYKDDLYTRAEPGAFIILIMTRWNMGDLAGRILQEEGDAAEGGEWFVINLPAVAGDTDILGRAPGEALCPERYDEEALARIKKVLGDSWYALYQGRPTAEEGNIIKRQWFRYYGTQPARNVTLEIVQSWDTASSEKELAAYSVCTTWIVTRLAYYLVDVYRERLDYPSLKRAAINQATKWSPNAVLIENKSSGMALIQDLKSDSLLPVISIEPEKDKITRLAVEAVAYEAGMVMHPERAPWLVDFEAELTGAPYAEQMDQCDSTSQFLGWARRRAFVNNWASSGKLAAEQMTEEETRKINTKKGWGSVSGGNNFNGWE
jgi:predicted phage terminase large subunit-like protein